MRKLALFLGVILCAGSAFAQQPRVTRLQTDEVLVEFSPLTATGASEWFDVTGYSPSYHVLTHTVTGAPAGVSLALECSRANPPSTASTIVTNTSTTGETSAVLAASCTHVRVNLTLTGTGTVRASYRGAGLSPSSSSAAVTQGTSPWVVSGTVTANNTTPANMRVRNYFADDVEMLSTDSIATPCYIVSAASTNATNCKAAAGNMFGIRIFNTTTTVYYLRLYNTVGAPTCSSATGFLESIPIPPASTAGLVGGFIDGFSQMSVAFATGISWCITGGSSSTDNTSAAVGIFGRVLVK